MNMHAPSPNKQKLSKLLRLLGSNVDGEVIAAARALVRTLENSGSNLHELVDIMESGGRISKDDMQKLYDSGFETGRAEGVRVTEEAMHGDGEFRSIGEPTFHEMALYCQKRIDRLEKQHHEFIDDMASKTLRYEPTTRQGLYLKGLFYRSGGGRR